MPQQTMTTKMSIFDIVRSLPNIKEDSQKFYGTCPIHNGDNMSAFCLYKESGRWMCFTHNCHMSLGTSVYSLMRGLGVYQNKKDFRESFVKKEHILNDKIEDSFSKNIISKKKFKSLIPDEPSKYFSGRGFSPRILKKYDVFDCLTPGKPMFNRAVVPIYDFAQENVIAMTGRDLTGVDKRKWLHTVGFRKSHYMYNIWFAEKQIMESKTAIIVEGPGDVWKLEEANIHCSVGIMGASLSKFQQILLSKLGTMNIIILTDNDGAGRDAAKSIYESCKNLYNVIVPKLSYPKDIGEMSANWIKSNISPILERF